MESSIKNFLTPQPLFNTTISPSWLQSQQSMVNDTQPNAMNGEQVSTRIMIQELASISEESSVSKYYILKKVRRAEHRKTAPEDN